MTLSVNNFEPEKIKLYKVFYFGFGPEKIKVNPPSSGTTVWIDSHSYHAYATIQHRLASAFITAEYLAQSGYNIPFYIDVYVSSLANGKYKDSDPETCIDRICFWLMHMEVPSCPIIIKVYMYNDQQRLSPFGYSDKFNCIWPLHRFDIKTSNYITLQKYENWGDPNNGTTKATRHNDGYKIIDCIEKEAARRNIDVINISYEMPFEDAICRILGGRGHFSYFGSSYYIAAALGVKSYIFGYLSEKRRKLIDHEKGAFLPSPWAGNNVTQFQPSTKKLITDQVNNFSFIDNITDVKNILDTGLYNVTN